MVPALLLEPLMKFAIQGSYFAPLTIGIPVLMRFHLLMILKPGLLYKKERASVMLESPS
jgi:hypothetical protein